jgi:excisionase family DNA binding protein
MDTHSKRPAKLAYGIAEACKSVGLGRSTLYKEITAGRLQTFKVGTRTLIRSGDLENWLETHAASEGGQ